MAVRRTILVSGRVQGVGFRASCFREARRLGVVGWVRNLPNRSVEVIAEGELEQVEALIAWCKVGPSFSKVESVQVDEEHPQGERSFEIKL
ncbi:MAG: acylphosphatase [Acidimicrobiales bacterium]|nr:acylphosphatase [Acidimicrobiales bacterium]